METTKNNLTDKQSAFFNKLTHYLATKLYYYGSIQGNDYFHRVSDIDVCIFTSNETETKYKLVCFLNINKKLYRNLKY